MTKEELLARLDSTEWEDFEVKDASHGIPKSVWETVSAFSNGKGGWILLGVRESKEDGIPGYEIVGLNDVENVEQSMGTTLRSTTKFNAPILATVEMMNSMERKCSFIGYHHLITSRYISTITLATRLLELGVAIKRLRT